MKTKQYSNAKRTSARYGIAPSTLWAWSGNPDHPFPKPVKFSDRCTRWDEDDLDEYDQLMKRGK